MDRFDASGHILADRDDMRHLARLGVFHRHLADHPVQGRTVVSDRLLLNTLDTSGAKSPFKFLTEPTLRVFFQNVKHVSADGDVSRYALSADFAMPIPRDDPIITVNNV